MADQGPLPYFRLHRPPRSALGHTVIDQFFKFYQISSNIFTRQLNFASTKYRPMCFYFHLKLSDKECFKKCFSFVEHQIPSGIRSMSHKPVLHLITQYHHKRKINCKKAPLKVWCKFRKIYALYFPNTFISDKDNQMTVQCCFWFFLKGWRY